MAYLLYMTCVGTKQGSFKGGSPQKGSGSSASKGGLPCHGFEYQVATQFDASSGLPSGKRQHHPFKITRESDSASPVLFQGVMADAGLKTGIPSLGFSGAGSSQGSGGAGGSTGRGHQVPIVITRGSDSASPVLFQGMATNAGFANGALGKGSPGSGSSKGSGSGSGSGKGHHGSIVITREADAASPLFWQALMSNELLTTVKIKWSQEKYGGGVWHVIELSNATIVNIRGEAICGAKGAGERLEFDFERVELKAEFA